jgi:hypothetical protein
VLLNEQLTGAHPRPLVSPGWMVDGLPAWAMQPLHACSEISRSERANGDSVDQTQTETHPAAESS